MGKKLFAGKIKPCRIYTFLSPFSSISAAGWVLLCCHMTAFPFHIFSAEKVERSHPTNAFWWLAGYYLIRSYGCVAIFSNIFSHLSCHFRVDCVYYPRKSCLVPLISGETFFLGDRGKSKKNCNCQSFDAAPRPACEACVYEPRRIFFLPTKNIYNEWNFVHLPNLPKMPMSRIPFFMSVLI